MRCYGSTPAFQAGSLGSTPSIGTNSERWIADGSSKPVALGSNPSLSTSLAPRNRGSGPRNLMTEFDSPAGYHGREVAQRVFNRLSDVPGLLAAPRPTTHGSRGFSFTHERRAG